MAVGVGLFEHTKELYKAGVSKKEAKPKVMNKWKRENIDLVWKELKLASKCFEQAWEQLEKSDGVKAQTGDESWRYPSKTPNRKGRVRER